MSPNSLRFFLLFCLVAMIHFSTSFPVQSEESSEILAPKVRRNMLMFSKLHRSVWPFDHQPKRFVAMDFDPEFDF
uniref:Uncharacterized protein n=1 Tax=Panagrolaimus sp. JU765 TaxID=591449 RepID=A0AC34RDH1_9BILA